MSTSVDYVAMGNRIRQLRKERNISQSELAASLGISPAYMGHIERGTRIPSLDTLARVAVCLGVSLDNIVLGAATAPVGYAAGRMLSPAETASPKMQQLNDVMRQLGDNAADYLD